MTGDLSTTLSADSTGRKDGLRQSKSIRSFGISASLSDLSSLLRRHLLVGLIPMPPILNHSSLPTRQFVLIGWLALGFLNGVAVAQDGDVPGIVKTVAAG